jgi:hypothetical protein
MHIGISESRTHKILNEEMLKVGLVDGDGLVLFGGLSRLIQYPSYQTAETSILIVRRRRRYATRRRVR